MTVTVYLRANQSNFLTQAQVDGNFQGLADGVNANAAAVVSANNAIAAQNVTIGNLGTQVANMAAYAPGAGAIRPTPTRPGQFWLDQSTTPPTPIWCSVVSPPTWINAAGVTV